MIGIRLKNPDIILTPITDKEIEIVKLRYGDNSLYVLYKFFNSQEINVGIMSETMQKDFPLLANINNLDNAVTKAYFYNGGQDLVQKANEIKDRPIYKIRVDDNRVVVGYDILNATPVNGLRIWLEDIVDGIYDNSNIKSRLPKKIK